MQRLGSNLFNSITVHGKNVFLTLFAIGAGVGVGRGGRVHIVPAADFIVCCGSIRDLEKMKFSTYS